MARAMRPEVAAIYAGWERECGPWFQSDRPEDVMTDIRLAFPDEVNDLPLAIGDVIAYLRTKAS